MEVVLHFLLLHLAVVVVEEVVEAFQRLQPLQQQQQNLLVRHHYQQRWPPSYYDDNEYENLHNDQGFDHERLMARNGMLLHEFLLLELYLQTNQ